MSTTIGCPSDYTRPPPYWPAGSKGITGTLDIRDDNKHVCRTGPLPLLSDYGYGEYAYLV